MYKLAKYSVALVLGLVLAASANANLIVNGSFEDNDVAEGTWQYFAADDVNGWDGSNIEIWDGLNGVASAVGEQHAELNAHPYAGEFSIFQNFATVVGQSYDVSFFYSARQSNAESFAYSVGSLMGELTDHVVGTWSQFQGSFIASSEMSQIRFTSITNGTVGNFLDGVVVAASVPEPGSLVLLALGLFGLGFARKSIARS
ncbi:PEP-CTERM sorting domain-containing protein [Simiduia curdlanivorans]|uniref:PEP-CTERM sorting domain-containing protein n=1 Tax=Simiduia curdlanivorans TaxID=1492769 RepID=A0ABV8V5L3_9GAMM|nr:PEP-CTERM sorting domain-containing protein [Simiduia curdlanivorans]MDN3641004.1 PEP-CTERM sorting domain-containing protein [Simiduia curdlanivorans]